LYRKRFFPINQLSASWQEHRSTNQIKLAAGQFLRVVVEQKSGRGARSRQPCGQAPRFTDDPKRPYAHPYYWAPFILIGNWR